MASSKYKKLEPREHVLTRPGMYIGSLEADDISCWIYNSKMDYNTISYISGLYKIYDEIIVNVLDHVVRSKDSNKPVKEIRVNINKKDGYIEVYNTGEGIEVEKHTEHNIYIPELVFGNMLTSTNYDDDVERTIGGQNGIGAKACNIYSKHFVIETVDSNKKKLYVQEFSDNMSKKTDPVITKYTKVPYTKIRFLPDYEKFNQTKLPSHMYYLMTKRVYDICALTPSDVKVFFNDEKIEYKNFEKYTELYLGSSKTEVPRCICSDENRWDVCISPSEDGFKQVSFVNGIYTIKGGKHVDYITNQITKKLADLIQKRKKTTVKQNVIKENLFLIIKSVINNPTFDSQTKETLTTPYSKFGSKFEIDDKTIDKIYKMNFIDKIIEISTMTDNKNAKKTDGKKKTSIRGLVKLDDANWAGTIKSKECTLILTEGDSAKTMAISGLSEIGRNKYGVFPLKGKVMNVKDTTLKKINENEEITALKKIIGLEVGKKYENVDDLRYGKVMILTDADSDGSHIKGLMFNLFHTLWPSLMEMNFLTSMLTPIVKVTKGKISNSFYNLLDYEKWKHDVSNEKSWNIKYYKGLGTSTNVEAKEYFKNMKTLQYDWDKDKSNESIELAFNKKRADDRKEWLYNYDKNSIINFNTENSNTNIEFSEFINKELIHFSNYNVERSIPSICDGLKKSLRKILYCCLKRNLIKEIKVAQLAGYVSEHGAYHHGEASLHEAIVGMAQTFVGSNNINLLKPNGQFGTRIQGGKDSASPRYIHTELNNVTQYIFHSDDNYILDYLEDDGMKIEPQFYMPIIPMILVNGSIGIGTGFSTNIPCYNPKDIISCLRKLMNDEEIDEILPWYKGFTGTNIDGVSKGKFSKLSSTKVEITELPIGFWTEDFKHHIENYMEKNPKTLKDYESHYTEHNVKFILHFSSADILNDMLNVNDKGVTKLENDFKLHSTRYLNTNNMHLYDEYGKIKKYNNVIEIIQEYYQIRIKYYTKRKLYKISKLEEEIKYLDAKVKFINDIINNKLIVNNVKKSVIIEYLANNKYPTHEESYDYLIKMPIYNLTEEKRIELEKETSKKHLMLSEIKLKTEKDIWKEDLNILEKYV